MDVFQLGLFSFYIPFLVCVPWEWQEKSLLGSRSGELSVFLLHFLCFVVSLCFIRQSLLRYNFNLILQLPWMCHFMRLPKHEIENSALFEFWNIQCIQKMKVVVMDCSNVVLLLFVEPVLTSPSSYIQNDLLAILQPILSLIINCLTLTFHNKEKDLF